MDVNVTLTATPRTETGKGPSRRLRSQGLLPCVFYGRGLEPRPLTVNTKEVRTIFFSGAKSESLINLKIEDGGSAEEKTAMLKDHQVDPIKQTLIHADFYEVDLGRHLEIEVPLVLRGKPAGVEMGGLLQQIRHALLISALPHDIPSQVEVDVSHLEMGESLHVEEIKAPEGVEIVFDVNFTLATVISPKGLKEEEEAEAEAEAGAEEGAPEKEAAAPAGEKEAK